MSELRPLALARADLGESLDRLSRLEMGSSVALGDPWGVAAVWVMMGAKWLRDPSTASSCSVDREMDTAGGG